MPTLLSVFDLPEDVAKAAIKLRGRGFEDLETYAPAPFEDVDGAFDSRPSKVRVYTLLGGLFGVVAGFAMQIWMSWEWPIRVGGKPYASIPPFVVIGFEMAILFAGILTLLGLLIVGGLYPRKLRAGYSSRFSAEEFGLVVSCADCDVAEIDALLRDHSAKEVTLVDS